MRTGTALILLAGGLIGIASCSSTKTAGPTAQCDLNTPAPQPVVENHALHNVHRMNDKIISGAVPENAAAFDELKAMGVKTIISVDGATPDVKSAQTRGIRYVHIPITYAEVTEPQRLAIARALKDLPGPIYVHCHHGKHRSPAAVAAAGVTLGIITPEQGVAFMKTAGTAPSYAGLYQCVAEATVASAAAMAAAPADFPSVHKPKGIVAAMIEVDESYEHLGFIKNAGWKTPPDHPDLVPAAEAGRLADSLRHSGEDPRAKAHGEDFSQRLAKAVASASALEEGILKNAPAAELEGHWKLVVSSCKDCHAEYRDKRK